jgi:capsid protein
MTASAARTQTRKTPLQKRNEELRLELSNTVLERRLLQVKALAGKYDAVEANRYRRNPQVETKSEDEALDLRKRLLSHNIGRDLERNFAAARGIIHQFRVNVVGSEGKIQVNIEGGDEAAAWFNQEWARDCDFRDSLHWSTVLQNVVAGCVREGDLLAVFDDGFIENSGKLIHFEADQIANLTPKEFTKVDGYQDGWTQHAGIVRDKLGRVIGYLATGKRGMTVIDKVDDATLYPRDISRLPKNPWRLNQGRGVSAILTAATNFQDLYEILSKELQSAKVAASLVGYTKRKDAVTDWDDPASGYANLPENSGKDAATTGAEGANADTPDQKNYERFEALTGGIWEYLDKEDEVEFPDFNRPNVHLAEFIESVLGHAGASMGLARAYTILRADSSYTSFRGDMILSWSTFYMLQKWLEREYADWVARKALTWAQANGKIASLPAGWERSISWAWPTMPNVDELKEENAVKLALKNGSTDFSRLLGPDWKKKLAAYAEQINEIRALNLPLSVLETIGGAVVDDKKENEE